MNSNQPEVQAFFDEPTNTATYLVVDPETRAAAIIDPVLDYDHRSGKANMKSADALLAAVQSAGLKVEWILETHAHADHLSAAPYLKLKTGAKVGIGEYITEVQRIFRPVFNLEDVSEINYDQQEGLILHTRIGGVPVHMGKQGFAAKLDRLEMIYTDLEPRLLALKYIDLNVTDRVIVKVDTKRTAGRS